MLFTEPVTTVEPVWKWDRSSQPARWFVYFAVAMGWGVE